MNESNDLKQTGCSNSLPGTAFTWQFVLKNLSVDAIRASNRLEYSVIEKAAAETQDNQEPPAMCKYDARPRWIAVSMAHPVEFELFQNDVRTKFYFADNGSGTTTPSVMSGDGYCWWIGTEPMFMREARLRQIFGAFVCREALPHMDPWNVAAYACGEGDPMHDMTAAITDCLTEVASGITAVPPELREPQYLRLEREQEDARSKSRKRSSD